MSHHSLRRQKKAPLQMYSQSLQIWDARRQLVFLGLRNYWQWENYLLLGLNLSVQDVSHKHSFKNPTDLGLNSALLPSTCVNHITFLNSNYLSIKHKLFVYD